MRETVTFSELLGKTFTRDPREVKISGYWTLTFPIITYCFPNFIMVHHGTEGSTPWFYRKSPPHSDGNHVHELDPMKEFRRGNLFWKFK